MTNPDQRLDESLMLWAQERQLGAARAEAIRRAVLLETRESDLPALSYRWWQELIASAMQASQRNPAVARYLTGLPN